MPTFPNSLFVRRFCSKRWVGLALKWTKRPLIRVISSAVNIGSPGHPTSPAFGIGARRSGGFYRHNLAADVSFPPTFECFFRHPFLVRTFLDLFYPPETSAPSAHFLRLVTVVSSSYNPPGTRSRTGLYFFLARL